MTYQAYTGWSSGTLLDITVIPRSPGLVPAAVVEAASGAKYDDGFYTTEWRYSMLTRDEYAALNTALGLTSARSAKVTISTRLHEDDTDNDDFGTYRAWVEKPTPNYTDGFHRDMVYRFTYLRAVS